MDASATNTDVCLTVGEMRGVVRVSLTGKVRIKQRPKEVRE